MSVTSWRAQRLASEAALAADELVYGVQMATATLMKCRSLSLHGGSQGPSSALTRRAMGQRGQLW